jgi:hypothetical protein
MRVRRRALEPSREEFFLKELPKPPLRKLAGQGTK